MQRLTLILAALFAADCGARAAAAPTVDGPPPEVFVIPTGDDAGPGTLERPFRTIARAVDAVAPGGTVFLRGALYRPAETIVIDRDGASAQQPSRLMPYRDEAVVIHGMRMSGRGSLLMLDDADFWHIKGLEVRHGPFVGVLVSNSSHCRLELLDVHHNGDSGVYVTGSSSDNLLINIDSHHNYDAATDGEHADGFAVKDNSGRGNVIRGARAWANADDGFDFWDSVAVAVHDSLAWKNGYDVFDHGAGWAGDGNGFKLGRGPGGHVVTRSIAWSNSRRGFDYNGSGPNLLVHNTAWNNPTNFRFEAHPHTLTNNVSHEGKVVIGARVVDRHNSWNLGVADPRFLSLDDALVAGDRAPNGEVRLSAFLRPAVDSPLIDAGVPAGYVYIGGAPDLGAVEQHW